MTPKKIVNASKKARAFREEENDAMVDTAADQQPPAPQPVGIPQQQPQNPALIPPQPGMIPTGWTWPQDSAEATAMETGDVGVAEANAPAPGAGVVDGAPITNEEAQVVKEYRKWNRKRQLEALKRKLVNKLRETEEEEELEEPSTQETSPQMNVSPEDDVTFEDEVTEDEIEDEVTEDENPDIEEELKDIAIDINKLFTDLGGDVEDVIPGEAEEEEEEEEESEPVEMPESFRRFASKKASMKESELAKAVQIKFPKGSEPDDYDGETEEGVNLKAYEKKMLARRELLKELRAREASLLDSDYEWADPDETIEDSTGDIVDDLAAQDLKEKRSSIVREASRSSKFLEKYRSKEELNFKELLAKGLLG